MHVLPHVTIPPFFTPSHHYLHTAAGGKLNASQFYITTGEDLDSLDEKYTIFGQVAEGMEVVDAINDAYCDDAGRPYQNIRCVYTFRGIPLGSTGVLFYNA